MNTRITKSPAVSNPKAPEAGSSKAPLGVLQPLALASPKKECSAVLSNKLSLLRSVLEGVMDGILILNEQGTVIDANLHALNLCRQLMQTASSGAEVPQQIWSICQELIKSRSVFPERLVILEDEIRVGATTALRIRARWITLHHLEQPCLLVVLEDRSQSLKNMAIAEAYKYGLTEREAQIWLLRRTNQTYKAIAAELHIAIDTVKKHIKSINAKREAARWAND